MMLFAWLALPLLVVTVFGCGANDNTPHSIEDPSGGGGSSGSGGSEADSSTDALEDSSSDSPLDSVAQLADSVVDTVSDSKKDVVVEYNTQPCPVASRPLGTKSFLATPPSPNAFVAAYNAELASMNYPGPILLVFNGLDTLDSTKWKLQLGPLVGADGSSKVSFASSPAEVPFVLGEGYTINFPNTPTNTVLRFATATTTADLPIVSISASGAFDNSCSTLNVEVVDMYIPATAASLPFHGSTVGALMGEPDQNINGGTANAWLLVLSGAAQAVEVQ